MFVAYFLGLNFFFNIKKVLGNFKMKMFRATYTKWVFFMTSEFFLMIAISLYSIDICQAFFSEVTFV